MSGGPYAHVVTGSEDGVIGVHSSHAKAVDHAISYVRPNDTKEPIVERQNKHYTTICRGDGGNFATADVERFPFE